MPVRDGAHLLPQTLPPLVDRVGDALLEVIVVDDGSCDGSGRVASSLGARVIRHETSLGPAAARNRGAEEARGDVLLFVDADVLVHPDAIDRVRSGFTDPKRCALVGSYDDDPRERNFASLYMNLRHHHVHHAAAGPITTFWAGCGAVRGAAFRGIGGFDADRFPYPSIEDIELGYRLSAAGDEIALDPNIQGTHLKRWSLLGVIHTDIARRALPWGRLLVRRDAISERELNVSGLERLRALVAGLFFAVCVLALTRALPAWAPLALWLLSIALNPSLCSLFSRSGGLPFAFAGLLMHQVYYVYAAGTYAYCELEFRRQSR